MRRDSGFTLIELMVTLAVAGVLLGIGVPSFADLVKKNRRTAVVNDLVTDIHIARAKAFAENARVVLCRGNGNALSPACTPGAKWTDGWLVFVDGNGNGDYESANDTVIGGRQQIPAAISVYGSVDAVSFSRFAGDSASFAVCIDDDDNQLRGIIVDRGRPRHGTRKTNGSNLTCS